MYKVKNPYKNCHIMDLNLLDISYSKRTTISTAEIICLTIPVIVAIVAIAASAMPELGFLAECQNIPGGDLCSISIK